MNTDAHCANNGLRMSYVEVSLSEHDLETLIAWGFEANKSYVTGLSDHEDILLSKLQDLRGLLR